MVVVAFAFGVNAGLFTLMDEGLAVIEPVVCFFFVIDVLLY